MLFNYKAVDPNNSPKDGSIEASNLDIAVSSLQKRGLTILAIDPANKTGLFDKKITFFQKVSNKDIVILSRQISTLFAAQVSALKVFNLLASESENPLLRETLTQISTDLQAGNSISRALEKHPEVFSSFYINMIRSGEETGKLDETFLFLADYLDRNYELTSKAKNALVYPIFVISTFVVVMVLMLTTVIPRISSILIESGQEIPTYTKVVIAISDLLTNFGVFVLAGLVIAGFFMFRWTRKPGGREFVARLKLQIPYVGELYKKLYLSRLADNMNTMLISGIPMLRALEVTAGVVDNEIYKNILLQATESVKGGKSVSESLEVFHEIPKIVIQMIRVGEETGELGNILKSLSTFYRREVVNAVDTLVGLIEPIMIVLLGLGVGLLLASVLIPIYNVSSGA